MGLEHRYDTDTDAAPAPFILILIVYTMVAEDAKNGDEGRGERQRTDTAANERRNEMIDRVARHRFKYY